MLEKQNTGRHGTAHGGSSGGRGGIDQEKKEKKGNQEKDAAEDE